jgi:uncharacterized NAD(P)/FAD-binding protein YdhS
MGIVAVVGGGLSGVFAARELLLAHPGNEVVLIDPSARPGRGLAYGAAKPWHLLNSPAGAMSADPDKPDDFTRWCRARDPRTQPGDFMPRAWYGDYLTDVLHETDRTSEGRLTIYRARVERIFEGEKLAVLTTDGVVIPADQVVLALGNARRAYADGVDPWEPGALENLPPGPVYLKGTGLTAVDVVLTLVRLGRTEIIAVSRHGLLPQRHQPTTPTPMRLPDGIGAGIRAIRKEGDWRAAFDGLRPRWDELWQRLSERQQESFLRHVARYWEVHRHRMAPAVADEIDALRAAGTLTVRRVGVPLKGFVDCTGPARAIDDRLVRTLAADGLVRPGPHGIGLDVTADGAVIGRSGQPHRALWTIGPMRRGVLWETTAVPEIRAQARVLARVMSRQMISRAQGAVR